MFKAQLAIQELKKFYKRRKPLLLLCPLLVFLLSIGASYMLPSKYESSITILVEKDQTLNPMVRYNMAVTMASEDRLRSFNEIIYSRPTLKMLVDSLELSKGNEMEEVELIKKVRGNIRTRLKASDSFSITYISKDPERAKRGVKLLSDHFIETKLQLENRRNDQTVDFFQDKLNDLKKTVQKRQKELISKIKEDVESTPRRNRSLQTDLERVENKLDDLNVKMQKTENKLKTIQSVISGRNELESLIKLDLESMTEDENLQSILREYQEVSKKYTNKYPRVNELRQKIYQEAERLRAEVQTTLFDQKAQKKFLQNQKEELTRKIQETTISERQTSQSKMDVNIYRKLYDEMKVKLEQAKTTREMGKNSKNQFVVIEPPIIPKEPSKPNRMMLIGGGLGLGIFLGLIVAAFAELLDTTIRRKQDVKEFKKPVVAYIPNGEE